MADKLFHSGDVYTNPIGDNVVVIDPNKVVVNGVVKDRLVAHEDLVMYANLSARIFPRSKILAGEGAGDEIIIDVWDGELNFMKPKGKDFLDSDWTDAFTNPDVNKQVRTLDKEGREVSREIQNQNDFQGFGITSISIKLNTSYIPQVTINFTDIRGKTLFEQARVNTPYTAFFHLPYPTFFLSLKGYYGKAVRYQMTMEKFVSRFDPSSGDYLITCDFKGNHIAMLRDINMHEAVTAPYMYPNRTSVEGGITSTKGRETMLEIYSEYRKKGLIEDNFPPYTLVELIEIVKNLDNDLGKLFGEADLTATSNKVEYNETLNKFKEAILEGEMSWKNRWLDLDPAKQIKVKIKVKGGDGSTGNTKTVITYPLKFSSSAENDADKQKEKDLLIADAKEHLDSLLAKYKYLLDNNATFREDGPYPVQTVLNNSNFDLFTMSQINSPGGVNVNINNNVDQTKYQDNQPYFLMHTHKNTFLGIWETTKKIFEKKAEEMSGDITAKLNTKLEEELGFRPSIRNVFAIIFAGVDTFLRLLDDTHTNAFNQRKNEARLKVAESSDDLRDTNKKENQIVFPWPQYYVTKQENECVTSSVLKYPGDRDVIDMTQAYNKVVWPEIDFVEEYTKTTAFKFSDFQFPTSNAALEKDFTPIIVTDWPFDISPYTFLTVIDIKFGILDRADLLLRYGGLDIRYDTPGNTTALYGEALRELGKYEANNIYNVIKEFPYLQQELGRIGDYSQLFDSILENDPTLYESYIWPNDSIYDEKVLNTITSVGIKLSFEPTNVSVIPQTFEYNTEALKFSKDNGFYDVAPTVMGSWVLNNFAGIRVVSPQDFYEIYKSLTYDTTDTNVLRDNDVCYYQSINNRLCNDAPDYFVYGLIGRWDELDKINQPFWSEFAYADWLDTGTGGGTKKLLTEGKIIMTATTVNQTVPAGNTINLTLDEKVRLTSILNTPYFINSIIKAVWFERSNGATPYAECAYLFLNSLPLPTFRERVGEGLGLGPKFGEEKLVTYISQLFNQMPAIHSVPIALLLRIGSIWWRYKRYVTTIGQPDILTNVWGNVRNWTTPAAGPAGIYDVSTQNLQLQYTFIDNGVVRTYIAEQGTTEMMVGVYPGLIDAIHYITTDQSSLVIPSFNGQPLNTILGPSTPLTISINTDIGLNMNDGSSLIFHDVYLDSLNLANTSVGVNFGNNEAPSRYYILYPSSGGLRNTDAGTYGPAFGDPALHNGACRFFWKASNYGYFPNNPQYQSQPFEYFKKVNPNEISQEAFEFNYTSDYSTIEELYGVFSKEQLDGFEKMFLDFSEADGSSAANTQNMKQLIKKMSIVSEDSIRNTDGTPTSDMKDVYSDYEPHNLANAQYIKIQNTLLQFLYERVDYAHESTNHLDTYSNGMTTYEAVKAVLDNITKIQPSPYNFGKYSNSATQIPSPGGFFVGNPQEWQDIRLHVGEFYARGYEFDILSTTDELNPIYKFFTTINGPDEGIEFNSTNIQIFAPFIRLYATYCCTVANISAYNYLYQHFRPKMNGREATVIYINSVMSNLQKKIADNISENETRTNDITDERPEIDAENLKLELYKTFKILNDRWVAGTDLTKSTLFDRFLFFDRANRDIGGEAIINIWDIIQLDSPFGGNKSSTLTQSVASFISTILANNYFNFIPLPAYINFFNVANGSNNPQLQGNAMFGTFKTVDYLESAPAFLCQYVGPPSSQLNVDTPNNGYVNDSFAMNRTANNPLISRDCGNKDLSNKVMGFTVDFGIPNQNIFESITLDQSQYQDTSESFKILQEMADSGGGGATSTASISLFNIYANRSYKASITCVGNVAIQPTQYFQLRYLPMFNGPYLILNVEHNITPNTMETHFEGVRVPIPTLPKIDNLVQRVNQKIYQKAEERLKDDALDLYLDNHSATKNQMAKTPLNNGFVDTATMATSPELVSDNVTFTYPLPFDKLSQPPSDPEVVHLGLDFVLKPEFDIEASSKDGIDVTASIHGEVIEVKDGCKPLQTADSCGNYGNYVEVKTLINDEPPENGTTYYITKYAFLKAGIKVRKGDIIPRHKETVIGQIGNSGLSEDLHLHFEILRYVKKGDKIVRHYLMPAFIIQ